MNKRIFEETGVQPHQGHAAGDTDVEKAASQLVSDVKYKVKKELGKDTSLNPAEVAKRYQQKLDQSSAPPAVKAIARKKLTPDAPSAAPVSEEVKDTDIKWVVVTDKKTGNTYRRRAGQAKRAELRKNPNISRVEVTGYHPNEDDDKQGQKTARVKAGKGLDQDGDGDKDFADVMSARMQASGMSKSAANKKVADKPYNKKGGDVKEGFSDWRSDLIEIVDGELANQKKTQIKEKNVENKITINPNIDLGEKINQMGGELIEMIEIDEEITFEGILDEICDAELMFLSNEIIEEAVEEFFLECIEEGYEIETVSDMLIESLDTSLEMIYEVSDSYYDSAVKTSKKNASKLRRVNRTQKVKDTVKKVGKSLLHGVGYAAKKVVDTAKKAGAEIKKGYQAAGSSDSESSSSGTRKPQPYRYAKKAEKKPGLASRLGSAVKKGLKKAVKHGAAAVSRGARNVARSMSEENIQEVSPPGFEGTVKAMKKHGEVDNPWALAWYMKKKGFKSHKTKTGKDLPEAMNQMAATQKQTQATQQDQKQQKLQQQQQAAADKPTPQERKLANIQKQQLAAKLKQVQTGTPLGEAKALGKTSSSDENPRGAAARASSGGGMTLTKAGGLGKSKSTKDNPAADDLRKKYYDTQAKADRRAAAKERAASGEDRVGRLIRSVQNSSYQPEGESIDELNRYEKETGINTKTNRPTQTGGAKDDKAFTHVKKMMRGMEGKPAGQRKKEPGKKPPVAGSYGAPASPAQKVAKRRAAAQRSRDNMSSRFD